MNVSLLDRKRIFRALLCSKKPTQTAKECSVCDRQEWLYEWNQDTPGNERFWPLVFLCKTVMPQLDFCCLFRLEKQW